ncbi:M28 family peptidase [Occallatibacter riparius]|uniref:M20/M25/M40 family metallo-hydrolase n=1 Tax=Occallatibacter riparius TaxID=1002689 RepID=A0A9J7BU23_9BACT|nr:M28 family peptidase [Occallatibacter riparius]UWZ86380.1 M20/M25/M40 family metallo-hydrolase [Occallatibacter riparius]
MRLAPLLAAFGIFICAQFCDAQPDYMRQARPFAAAPANPAIARAIASVDSARIRQIIEKLVSFQTRNSLSSMETDLPAGTGIQPAADWIYDQFQQISTACNGCLDVRRDTFTADPKSTEGTQWAKRIPRPTRMTNVYAILRGSDSAQANTMYLVTGHYDSRNTNVLDDHGFAPGANDDASGVAVSLECARVLSKMKFPASLVFVAVAGEEQGLVGSAHLAKVAKEQGWNLLGVLNNDIVGGNTTPGDTLQLKDRVRVFSEGVPVSATPEQARRIRAIGNENDSPSRELARAMQEASQSYFPAKTRTSFDAFLVSRPDRYLRGGDHSSFNREGFAAVRITEWREDYNHQHQNVQRDANPVLGDLVDFVDFTYVAKVARLNAATLATLASSPGEPQKVQIDAEKLENGTTLKWEGAPGKVDHYELLWRDTIMPDWQYVKKISPAANNGPLTVTVPISKDNVIFGVRAVDAAGHRGIVVVP